jgi:DNA-directed RNA polymerase subunit RPC12/RpoP
MGFLKSSKCGSCGGPVLKEQDECMYCGSGLSGREEPILMREVKGHNGKYDELRNAILIGSNNKVDCGYNIMIKGHNNKVAGENILIVDGHNNKVRKNSNALKLAGPVVPSYKQVEIQKPLLRSVQKRKAVEKDKEEQHKDEMLLAYNKVVQFLVLVILVLTIIIFLK